MPCRSPALPVRRQQLRRICNSIGHKRLRSIPHSDLANRGRLCTVACKDKGDHHSLRSPRGIFCADVGCWLEADYERDWLHWRNLPLAFHHLLRLNHRPRPNLIALILRFPHLNLRPRPSLIALILRFPRLNLRPRPNLMLRPGFPRLNLRLRPNLMLRPGFPRLNLHPNLILHPRLRLPQRRKP